MLLDNNKHMCVGMTPAKIDALIEELREAAGRGEGALLATMPSQTEKA